MLDVDRALVCAEWQRGNDSPLGALTKADLKAAVDAIDAWIDANAASFNQAIPQPARGALTAKQKAWLFFFVVRRRFEVA
jgi:hypothetical protein